MPGEFAETMLAASTAMQINGKGRHIGPPDALFDLRVAPAVRKRASRRKGDDALRMADELGAHVAAGGAGGAYPAAHQELAVERVLDVDGKAPAHARRRRLRRDGGVVAKVEPVRKPSPAKSSRKLACGSVM